MHKDAFDEHQKAYVAMEIVKGGYSPTLTTLANAFLEKYFKSRK